MPRSFDKLTIIGAGLGGLSLALCLHHHGISCTVYEGRRSDYVEGYSIVLSPNGLRVLGNIDPGFYDRLCSRGFRFENTAFVNEAGLETGSWPFGGKKYGEFDALCIARQHVLQELIWLCERLGIPIMWEKSFSHIVSNTPRGVTFAFKDGSTAKSDLLVGADGINSAVRAFVSPGTNPEYVITALNFCVPATTFPKDFPARFSMTTQHGAFIATPQNPLGKEKLCFRLLPISEPEGNEEVKKREWKRLAADKEWALSMLRKDIDSLPELWRMAIDSVDKVHIGVWPFHVLPKLPSWASLAETEGGEGGGIILIGDSAHGLPPSGAQGANQAFEDAYTLAFALSQISTDAPLKTVLESWQNRRTERVDQISRMTMQMNVARLPPQAQQKLIEEGKWSKSWERSFSGDFYRWLYVPNLKESFLDQVKDS